MHSSVSSNLLLLFASAATLIQGAENFNATFGSTPKPFKINVDEEFIAHTKLKASLTRYPIDIDVPDFSEGPPHHNVTTVRDFWVNEYDWKSVSFHPNEEVIPII